MGPKRFLRILRAQRATGLLRAGQGWNQVAGDLGYVDQSHLCHEIRDFSGMTPRGLTGAPPTELKSFYNRSDSACDGRGRTDQGSRDRAGEEAHFYNTAYL